MKLSDICTLQSGGTPSRKKEEYWKNGNIPWLKISDLKEKFSGQSEEFITEKGLENSSAKLFMPNTILLTIFATIGNVSILTEPASTNQAIAGISLNSDLLIVEYLYYWLLSKKSEFINSARGVAQNNINLTYLKNLDVPIVNKDVQLKICQRLSLIEKLIKKNQEMLSDYDLLVKSREVFPLKIRRIWRTHK